MNWNFLVASFKDPYERKARLFPGLLVILPLLISICCVFGPTQPIPTAVLTLVATAGGTFALASLSRSAGKRLEEKLVAKWGGMPTTIILRYRDNHYNRYTKQAYHQKLGHLSGIELPTAQEETVDPTDADERYEAVTAKLRGMTRGPDFPHLRRENIAYGFYRNALALKAQGIASAVLGILLSAFTANAFTLNPPYVAMANILHPGAPIALAMISDAVIAIAWLSFTQNGLRRVGFAYAERLFECLDSLPQDTHSAPQQQSEGQP